MDKKSDNPLRRVDRQQPNYPLIAATVLTFSILIIGTIWSISRSELGAAGVFAAALVAFAATTLIDVANRRRLAAVDDRKFIRWNAALPEIQRQNVNVEVRELARLLGVGDANLADLLSAYIVAEDLALRQIQQEEDLPLMRHVSIGGTPFDAILIANDLITCIEISFLVVPDIRQEKIEAMLKKITLAKKNLMEQRSRLRLCLMVVLVTQLNESEEERLRGMLVTRRFSDTPVDIDIRMLDFEMLQKVYVSE
jgi:hypothetical protein